MSVLLLTALLMGMSGWGKPSAPAAPQEHLKQFTVADSIAMTHFIDPSEEGKGVHAQFSPDGKYFLIVTERGILASNVREYSLLIYNAQDLKAKPVLATVFSTSSNRDGISGAHWLNNDIVTLIGENPGKMPQIYAVNWITKQTRKLTSAPDGTIGNYSVTPDLRMVMYSTLSSDNVAETRYREQRGFAVSNETLPDLITGKWKKPQYLYQMFIRNTVSGKTILVKGGDFSCAPWLLGVWLSPNGNYAIARQPAFPVPISWAVYNDPLLRVYVQESRSMQSRHDEGSLTVAMLVDATTGDVTPLLHGPLSGFATTDPNSIAWSSDSRSVIVNGIYLPLDQPLSTAERARRVHAAVLAEFSIPSRSFNRIAEIPNDQAWSLGPGTASNSITLHVNYHTALDNFEARPDITYLRHGNTWVKQVGQSHTVSTHPDITITESRNKWPRLIAIHPKTHQVTIITDPNPQLRFFSFGYAQTIHWTGKAGEALVGGLIYPVGYRPGVRYPLVIETHGYDPDLYMPDGSYTTVMASQEFANKGIAVLQLGDTPLNEQAEPTLQEAPVNVSMFESAIDYLDTRGIIDRQRVGLSGFSRTAYHVKYAIAFSKYHFAAATAAEGIDFSYWMYTMDPISGVWGGQFDGKYGVPWAGNWKSWMDHSITFNFDKIHTPLRIESDSNPDDIIAEWEAFTALRRLHKPVDLIFLSHGAHPNVKPWDRMTSQQGNVDWMVFWLKGQEDPTSEKHEQYARWRTFRKLQSQEAASNS